MVVLCGAGAGGHSYCGRRPRKRSATTEFIGRDDQRQKAAAILPIPATLNGEPVARHPGTSLREGLTGMRYSTRLAPEAYLRHFEALLRAGGMFYRDGSGALNLCYVAAGRLLDYYEPHINSWDCLGAIAVIEAGGLKVNNFLANDGLARGNPIIAAVPEVYGALLAISQL